MQSARPSESAAAGFATPPGLALGESSRRLRFVIVTVVVAIYVAFGFLLHLDLAEYQLLGILFLLAFQLGIRRQPLRAAWVSSGPPLRLDARFLVLWLLFSLMPAYLALTALARSDPWNAALYGTGIVGAAGLAYALRGMRAANFRQLGLCLLTVGAIGILPQLLAVLLPGVLHLHVGAAQTQAGVAARPALTQGLLMGLETFLWGLPAGFMVEEVFFRGALDGYLHRGEAGIGWLSAVYVSALWGLWHLPGATQPSGSLLSTIVGLLVAQILVGVPLSYWRRKSGNLTVDNAAHALLDAVRGTLAATL